MTRKLHCFALLALAAMLVRHPGVAAAHGVGSREMDPGVTRDMVFLYADGEPMAFAQVQVTGPDGAVYQSARTDGRGGFAFLPSGSGVWRVAASDGQGHRAEREITVAAAAPPTGAAAAAAPAPGRPQGVAPLASASASRLGPGWQDVTLGLSLLGNLALGLTCWRRRTVGRCP